MTRKHSNNTFVTVGRAVAALGILAAAGIATAQDTAGTRYARTLADADITARYNVQLEQQVRSQQGEIASLEQQLAGVDATAAEVQPLLQRMFDELDQFVASDLPFLNEERTRRIDNLRALMTNLEATTFEKYRKLMEAYQIEMEYGRTLGWYRQKLADGRDADFVRLGRVSLMYQTADGTETGYWDQQGKKWVPDNDYSRAVQQALRIAKQEGAPDLITVPVPAPQGGRS